MTDDVRFLQGPTSRKPCAILARPTAISVPSGPFVVGAPILLVASSVIPSTRGSIIVPASVIIKIRGSVIITSPPVITVIIVPCRPFIILPPGGWRPGATIVVVGAARWGSGAVAAVWSTIVPATVAVFPIAIITGRSVFARRTVIAIFAAVIVRATTLKDGALTLMQ